MLYAVSFASRPGINAVNSPIANLWSPTRKLRLKEVGVFLQTLPTNAPIFAVQRTTARGTQTSTSTPGAQDPSDDAATAVLDLTWSVNPTLAAGNLAGLGFRLACVPNTIGNGAIWNMQDLEVAPGAGLELINILATGATLGAYCGYFLYNE